MKIKVFIVFLCAFNLWPTHVVEQRKAAGDEKKVVARSHKIDTLSPLFLINF